MFASSPEPESDDPPVLLKRLGNGFEGDLARRRLESAGIPSFVAGVDSFGGPRDAARGQVELFVPASFAHEALDVLDAPPLEEGDEPLPDDPGRPLAFRAFVAAVGGWMAVVFGPIGVVLAVSAFVYSVVLALRAVRMTTTGERGLRFQVALSIGLAILGTGTATTLTWGLLNP